MPIAVAGFATPLIAALAAFFWSLRNNQFEDPDGEAELILSDRCDEAPREDE